jgi:phage shock protein C
MEFREWLNKFGRSAVNRWLGGVCGGLEAGTGLPAWIWRLMFILLIFFFGTGLLLYMALWILLPVHGFTERDIDHFSKGGNFGFVRVKQGRWVAGICAGLGIATGTPAWVFRLAFLALVVANLTGLILYIFLWISVPKENAV